MRMSMKWVFVIVFTAFILGLGEHASMAQDASPDVQEVEEVLEEDANSSSFFVVISNGGFIGVILWLSIFICSTTCMWLIIDSFITIQHKKIVPQILVEKVRDAMEQGDVMKAIKQCNEEPGALSNILSAGFGNVEEGFEAVQESVGVAADLESEKLLQRITYLNVVGNLAPMLGLLGTVQGMILAFATLGTGAGAARQSMLALNISQALYTTAAGLAIAIPAVAFFFFFRNRAINIILGMEALTLDLIKVLRNVEVVEG